MRHPRVRRPFIVESRGSSRDSGSVAIPKRAQQTLQAQAKPAVQAAAPFFDPWAAITAPVEPTTAPRRILPNIMTPPEPDPVETAPEAPPAEEARLPRVRRVKPRAPRVEAEAIPQVAEPAPQPTPAPVRQEPALPFAARPAPRPARSGRAALPAGQRWKARLPRACW